MIQHSSKNIAGVEIHFAELASSAPPIVIIHGLTDSMDGYLPIMLQLEQVAHVYCIDLRGHGQSAHVPDSYRIKSYAADVLGFLETTVREPAVLIGHSLGGLVTSYIAAQSAITLRGILLEDPPLYTAQMPTIRETNPYRWFVSLRDQLAAHRQAHGTVDDLCKEIGDRRVAQNIHRLDPSTLSAMIEGYAFDGFDPDIDLRKIKCPAHLISANCELGGAMREDDVNRVLQLIPQCTHSSWPDCGHGMHHDHPRRFVEDVCSFLQRLE